MNRLEKVIKDIYRHKLTATSRFEDIGKCSVVVNVQDFIDGYSDPQKIYSGKIDR